MRFGRPVWIVAMLAWGMPLAGRAQSSTPMPSPAASLLNATLGLVAVVAIILAIGWFMRRFAGGSVAKGALQIIAATSVGQRERVVVVRYRDQTLMLGVAPGRVNLLQALPAQADTEPVNPGGADGSANSSFLERFTQAMRRNPHA